MKASLRLAEPPATDADAVTAKSRVPILVVDDNAGKRLALRAVLLPLGYCIVEADSGEAALRCVMAQDFAVILLDVRMPGMDGFETASLIRLRRQSEMTPIILVTAHDTDDIVNDSRYAESDGDFIFAPVPPEELRAIVSVFANLFLKAETLAAEARSLQKFADERRLLADAAPIGMFQTDAANRYVYTNPRWSEITGIAPDVAAGQPWDTILSAQQREELLAESGDGALQREELTRRFAIQVPGPMPGSVPGPVSRIVLVMLKAVPDSDGGIAGWIGTLADVTTEVGAEVAMAEARDQANEASRLKSDFLANMSHELRTPMNGVLGMTELLLDTDLDTRQRDYAQTVRNSGEALLTIISDILDFSKVEAGKLEIEDIEFDVQRIVDEVVGLLGGSAQIKGLELVAVLESPLPAVVSGDPGRVRQVLTNLIGNAIKFTQTGEIVVSVSSADAEASGADAIIRFEVADTGAGIAPDKLVPIFQPFVQADTSTSREYGGTGLGLAISSQLVALMGGDCGVSSQLGIGSTFWFTIRVHTEAGQATPRGVVPGPEEALPATAAQSPALPEELQRGRLLLAEDNLVNQKVAVAMLSSVGYRVDTVRNGASAVKAAGAQPYNAILMDCQMPGLNGYEATAAIRAQEGPGRHTPIIAVTAGARQEDRERCLAEGMDGYLAKPVSKEALLAVVARFVKSGAAITATDVAVEEAALNTVRALGDDYDPAFFAELVDTFVRETETQVVELRGAVEAWDAVVVARVAHSMMGSGGQMGGQRLALACGRLEERANAGDMSEGHGDLVDIEAHYQELRGALMARLSAVEATTSPEPTSPPPGGAAMRILVADDDPTFRLIIQRAVRNLGHECHTAVDGTQAWDAFQSGRFDVVISDLRMPGLNGAELCSNVRAHPGGYTYFIMVTGPDALNEIVQGMGAGADDYLLKPIDRDDLHARLVAAARITSVRGQLADRTELQGLNHEVTDTARRDPLTGLGNRPALEADLHLLETRAARYGHRCCVALLDVDLFTSYTDAYGDQAGDQILETIAAQIKEKARGGDALYRYGGDRFLCIFPEQSLATGTLAVERMRIGLERLAIPHAEDGAGVLTLSAGIAMLEPGHPRPALEVVNEADQALRRAKQGGRNRVERPAAAAFLRIADPA